MGIHSYDAAAAAVAQSIANAAQDQVDLIRNQNVIKTTVAGSAYAKWLANPIMKDEFKAIIDDAKTDEPKDAFNLAHSIFETYKNQNFASPNDSNSASGTEPENATEKSVET